MEDGKTGHLDTRSQTGPAISRWISLLGPRDRLSDNIESQFQTIPVSLMQMYNVERVREAMESFALALALASEPLLGKANRGLQGHRRAQGIQDSGS